MSIITFSGVLILLALTVRTFAILSGYPRRPKPSEQNLSNSKTRSVAVFLGSGGHTSEAMMLVSALDFSRYTPRTYVVSEGDTLSAHKATTLEQSKAASLSSSNTQMRRQYNIEIVPRARRVHQSLLTTPSTALLSLMFCIYLVSIKPLFAKSGFRRPFADVLILNGPGTCVILCVAVLLNKFIGLPSPRIIYVESFARVRSLSLSGRLLCRIVDRFIVQWPELARRDSRKEYRGWLV
ncbi:glycosyltransferase family 1 protein [Hygrophoropsis aurantiaca]|uniref:Glycosyltransferase family 1 protein n=1 Tax=Hygrophoropsis aurantiaca TaxID=72124 RepID=A0ACB8A8A8_9AGAM|nr:glycosyltransferase family 1 protein [Hygrophoropsis aurantiaca]